MKLTPKQQAFADYYIELGNAEQAAIKAGYSEGYARGNAFKLVANSGIEMYIAERMSTKEKERIASQDEVLELLTRVIRGEEVEEVPISNAKEIQIVKKTPSIKDKIKAAELLGKRYALFTDKVQHMDSQRVTIVNDIDLMKRELADETD